jgi:hypothetical protein
MPSIVGTTRVSRKTSSTVYFSVVGQDPHHFGNLDPDSHPDPHPHQIKIRIRIIIYKLDPDPHQFADVKPKCKEY